MALSNDEIIYLDRDNSVDLVLYSNSSAQDLSSVTEIRLVAGSAIVTSTDAATGFIRWNQAGYDTGEIRIVAGGATQLSTGRFTGALVVFDPSNTSGIVWDDDIPLCVRADPLST